MKMSQKTEDVLTLLIVIVVIAIIIGLIILGIRFPIVGICEGIIAFILVSWATYINFKKQGGWIPFKQRFKKRIVVIKNAFDDQIWGERHFVRVNKTWSVHRGKHPKKQTHLLRVKYGLDRHDWTLEFGNFEEIKNGLTDEEIDNLIVKLNIAELKKLHRRKYDKSKDLEPLEDYYWNRL